MYCEMAVNYRSKKLYNFRPYVQGYKASYVWNLWIFQ
jgi:hypothetical protein